MDEMYRARKFRDILLTARKLSKPDIDISSLEPTHESHYDRWMEWLKKSQDASYARVNLVILGTFSFIIAIPYGIVSGTWTIPFIIAGLLGGIVLLSHYQVKGIKAERQQWKWNANQTTAVGSAKVAFMDNIFKVKIMRLKWLMVSFILVFPWLLPCLFQLFRESAAFGSFGLDLLVSYVICGVVWFWFFYTDLSDLMMYHEQALRSINTEFLTSVEEE